MEGNNRWLMALDLSTPGGVLALEGSGGLFHSFIEGDSRVSRLFAAADEIISAAAITPGEIGVIGVGRGPGSFTGVRVGVMAAKVLANVLQIPLVAPNSLEVVAMGAENEAEKAFVVLDARRGEVYFAFYRMNKGGPVVLEGPSVALPEVAAERISRWSGGDSGEIALLGTGVTVYPRAWPEGMHRISRDFPAPGGLTRLCRRLLLSGETVDPMELLPLYIRRPDARARYCGAGGEGSCD